MHAYVLSHFSHVRLFVTPWIVTHQAPISMRFSRHEYWRGLPCPPPEYLPNLVFEPMSFMSPALASRFFTTSITWKAHKTQISCEKCVSICFQYEYLHLVNISMEKAMATHASTLAWKILWMEEPGRLQSMGSLGVGHD